MKKLIIAASLLTASVLGASAQSSILNSPDNHPYLGIRASLDVTCPGDLDANVYKTDIMDNGAGFSLGAVYNVPIVYNLYFEPGVSIYHHTAKVKDKYAQSDGYSKISISEWGFEVPLMFGYTFDFNPFKISVFTGPEFRVGLSGKTKYTAYVNNKKMTAKESMYGDDGWFNRGDVSWRFGVGFNYDHYYLSVSGAAGMCNWINDVYTINLDNGISTDGKASMHRNTVSVAIGYNF
jgi:hypothetical protein